MAKETPSVVVNEGLGGIEFYGEVDKNQKGQIASEYPAFCFPRQKEILEEDIRKDESAIKRGIIPDEHKPYKLADIERKKGRLDKINEATPVIEGKTKDAVSEVTKDIGKRIAESMFSRSDMMKGTCDAHEEARRMSEPIIDVKSDNEAAVYKKLGINIKNGRVSRDEAAKAWKVCRRMLGEGSNIETLRRA